MRTTPPTWLQAIRNCMDGLAWARRLERRDPLGACILRNWTTQRAWRLFDVPEQGDATEARLALWRSRRMVPHRGPQARWRRRLS